METDVNCQESTTAYVTNFIAIPFGKTNIPKKVRQRIQVIDKIATHPCNDTKTETNNYLQIQSQNKS